MYHILVAEDERIERMALVYTLSGALGDEYCIHQAENGRQAVEIFRQYPIGIAILDIEMPVMNGIDTAQIIHRESPHCAILFLTAYDRFDYAQHAIRIRAIEYLLKPYSDQELLSAVQGILRHSGATLGSSGQNASSCQPEQEMSSAVAAQMLNYIYTHYQQEISTQDAAHALNYSDQYFCRIFKQLFGTSFTAYLSNYRIQCAQELLCQPTISIKDIGMRVGYPDANYFSKVFRRITGQTPSEYRLQHLKR